MPCPYECAYQDTKTALDDAVVCFNTDDSSADQPQEQESRNEELRRQHAELLATNTEIGYCLFRVGDLRAGGGWWQLTLIVLPTHMLWLKLTTTSRSSRTHFLIMVDGMQARLMERRAALTSEINRAAKGGEQVEMPPDIRMSD